VFIILLIIANFRETLVYLRLDISLFLETLYFKRSKKLKEFKGSLVKRS
jgi:hypothetical protein